LEFADQISKGIEYLHSQKVVHRDLKPDNIFVSADEILYIGDFGLIHEMDNVVVKQRCGTPGFVAPEVWCEEEFSFSSDLFGFGCILVYMVTKTILWKKFKFEESNTAYEWLREHIRQVDFCEFVITLLDFDASIRPTATESRL
jgi:serine/threonine protein kinase